MSSSTDAPSVEIREVDRARAEETGFRECFAILAASAPVDTPWASPPEYGERLARFRHVDPQEDKRTLVAWVGDQALGRGIIHLSLADNTDKAFVDVLVHPDHRHRGIGTALARHLLQLARDHGRAEAIGTLEVPPDADTEHPSRAFARAMGFELANTEILRELAVPVDEAVLERLAKDARPHHAGDYRLASFTDGVPDDVLPGLCAAMNRLPVDAPTGGVDFEAGSFSPEQYKDYLALGLSTGGHRYETLAFTADGEVAAYSTLFTAASAPETAHQGGTLVTGPHRGHRLGMAVKVENLRRLAAEAPQVRRIMTGNAEQNNYMVSINVALGFEIIAIEDMFVRREPVS